MVPPLSDLILGKIRTLWHVTRPLSSFVGAIEVGYCGGFLLRLVKTGGGNDA